MPDLAEQYHCFVFMPYIHMGDCPEIDLGFLKLWNFDIKKDINISEPQLKSRMTELLATYQNRNTPVRGIGILLLQPGQLKDVGVEALRNIKEAQLILFLSFLTENNTAPKDGNSMHSMATSENFSVIYQGTHLPSNFMAENAGVILPRSIGEQIGTVKYNAPGYILHSYRFNLDTQLLGALLELRIKKPRTFKKIINATAVFFESYYNTESLSQNARILLQMSAFEILLDLDPETPNGGERRDFKDKIEKLTLVPDERKDFINYFEKRKGKKGKEARSLKGIWADKFYTLRNHIIHGLTPLPEEFIFKGKQLHTDIALLFFIVCVEQMIQKSLKIIFENESEIIWKKWHNDNFNQDREEFVYELSWRRLHARIVKRLKKEKQL